MSRDLAERVRPDTPRDIIAFLVAVHDSGERLNDNDRGRIAVVLDRLAESTPAAPDEEGLRTALAEMVAAFDALRGQTIWVDDDGKGTVARLRTAHEAASRALASQDKA